MTLARESARTGEPIVRSLEYAFPHRGYESVRDEFMLGDIDSASFHFNDDALIEVENLKAHHNESRYDVPSMRIDLAPAAGPVIDALAKSANFDLEDLYAILKMTGDPLPHCQFTVERAFEGEGPAYECVNRRFFDAPDDHPESIRAFDLRNTLS